MRIGVDGACLANGRGYGRFTRELLSALVDIAREHEFVLYADRASLAAVDLDAPNVHVRAEGLLNDSLNRSSTDLRASSSTKSRIQSKRTIGLVFAKK